MTRAHRASHIFALESKLEDIFAEGLEARYARHRKTSQMTVIGGEAWLHAVSGQGL